MSVELKIRRREKEGEERRTKRGGIKGMRKMSDKEGAQRFKG